MSETAGGASRTVTFIESDRPPLEAGEYTLTVVQEVDVPSPGGTFTATRRFAVAGERFAIDPSEIHGVFPPDLANGEYTGALPQVVFARRTLPWERTSIVGDPSAPWLAVLLFDDGESPVSAQAKALDLVADGTPITVAGSDATGTGALPPGHLSYPTLGTLDWGESPDDACAVIDLPVALFSAVIPSRADLKLTVAIREVDGLSTPDASAAVVSQYAVVMGNRVAKAAVTSHAFLVSLEHMGDYLPGDDGQPSAAIPAGTTYVRLVTFRHWTFTANTLDETFTGLIEHLDIAGLCRGLPGPTPTADQVTAALGRQATGTLTAGDAAVLVANALGLGYLPFPHHLRGGGQTVSWYRGPLVPYPVAGELDVPISCPDGANRYDPQTGMFDVSYGAAWQLGQLLAVHDGGFANALYTWKRAVGRSQAVAAEHDVLQAALQGEETAFSSFLARRSARVAAAAADPTQPPPVVVDWLARLRLLHGVPFQYLVPDPGMLPPESLRVFHVDSAWVDALVDGAFSIGRSTTGDLAADAVGRAAVADAARLASRALRLNPRPATDHANEAQRVTGFVLRSQAVSGWPRIGTQGFADVEGSKEIPLLRLARLSGQVLVALFDGVVEMVTLHEPPEQLHSGVELHSGGGFTTTLRTLSGAHPGRQLVTDSHGNPATAVVPARPDGQTLALAAAATSIVDTLNAGYGQAVTRFTSAEFALQMVKGVARVEFRHEPAGGGR